MPEREEQSIGIFDSGIGGLTVAREIMRRLPHESIVYFGDTARVPYGSKSADVVRHYALEDARLLVNLGVKIIVVACNTVSAVALEEITAHFSLPTIGVLEPGARAAAALSTGKRIGVIGTRATVSANSYTRRIHDIDPSIDVFSNPCPLFVPLAEEGWEEHPVARLVAEEYLAPMKEADVDTLILGCTHYPVLRPVIASTMGEGVRLVDSGKVAAADVEQMLDEHRLRNPRKEKPVYEFYVSDIPQKFQEIAGRFLGTPIGAVKTVDPSVH